MTLEVLLSYLVVNHIIFESLENFPIQGTLKIQLHFLELSHLIADPHLALIRQASQKGRCEPGVTCGFLPIPGRSILGQFTP